MESEEFALPCIRAALRHPLSLWSQRHMKPCLVQPAVKQALVGKRPGLGSPGLPHAALRKPQIPLRPRANPQPFDAHAPTPSSSRPPSCPPEDEAAHPPLLLVPLHAAAARNIFSLAEESIHQNTVFNSPVFNI